MSEERREAEASNPVLRQASRQLLQVLDEQVTQEMLGGMQLCTLCFAEGEAAAAAVAGLRNAAVGGGEEKGEK